MSLDSYTRKRDFNKTNEPKPSSGRECQQRYVVQEHHASHLHYDFRMEMMDDSSGEVVLRSWAVPKNLPVEGGVKHLAIQTEDHPVAYLSFEGTIPAGNYGAGEVEIWDKGKWGLMIGSLDDGLLRFNLLGEKIKGRFTLVRTKGVGEQKRDDKKYWLIWRQENEI